MPRPAPEPPFAPPTAAAPLAGDAGPTDRRADPPRPPPLLGPPLRRSRATPARGIEGLIPRGPFGPRLPFPPFLMEKHSQAAVKAVPFKPEASFRANGVSVSVFRNKAEDGREFLKLAAPRRYRDPGGALHARPR